MIEGITLTPNQVFLRNTHVHRSEASASGRKTSQGESHIYCMPCSNVSGTHKMSVLLPGKCKNPTTFENVNSLLITKNKAKRGYLSRCSSNCLTNCL